MARLAATSVSAAQLQPVGLTVIEYSGTNSGGAQCRPKAWGSVHWLAPSCSTATVQLSLTECISLACH